MCLYDLPVNDIFVCTAIKGSARVIRIYSRHETSCATAASNKPNIRISSKRSLQRWAILIILCNLRYFSMIDWFNIYPVLHGVRTATRDETQDCINSTIANKSGRREVIQVKMIVDNVQI